MAVISKTEYVENNQNTKNLFRTESKRMIISEFSEYTPCLKGPKENKICTLNECQEAIHGRHMAQHPAAVKANNIISNLRAKKTFIKKDVGSYRGFGFSSLFSVHLNLAEESREKMPPTTNHSPFSSLCTTECSRRMNTSNL